MDANLSETSSITDKWAAFGEIGAARQHNTSMNLQNSNILTFHKIFGSIHELTITGVFEQSKNKNDFTFAQGTGSQFTEQMLYYGLGLQTDKTINSGYSSSSLRSYVGRINYTLSNKYLITASYRADGSSKFPNNRWGYFPSFGLGWKASEENFIKDLNIFSNMKIRGGWGVTGNQGASSFATIPQMSNGGFGYGTTTGNYTEISNITGDEYLRWEQTAQTDIGFDMGFFKNRLNFSADYFNKQTKDLLLRVPTPDYWGGGNNLSNVGSVENKGIELVLSAVPVDSKDFTWNISLNYSSYKNKVLELGGGAKFINSTITNLTGTGIIQNDFLRNIVGESMATFYGNKFLGIYQESEATEAALFGMSPGDNKYLDVNNDYLINGDDKVIIGHALPKFTWALDNTIRFRNFELNLFVQAVNGNDIFNMDYALASSRFGDSKTITNAEVISWTSSNKNNKWPSLTSSSNTEIFSSSKWLQDGSFIRIKNVSLSYRIPSELIKGAPLKVSISGQNLFTFTKFKGYDPEASSGGNDDINQGVVSGAYPSARIVTFSLQLNF